MDNRDEVRDFLVSRRGRLTPADVGLGTPRGHRRVPGLRRSEVADLAGVSVEYYARLERGDLRSASEEVLAAIAGALRMNEDELSHLFDLARAAGPGRRSRVRAGRPTVRPALDNLLAAMTDVPAFIADGRLDIVAINPLGRALYSFAYDGPPAAVAGPRGAPVVNLARFCFLDPRAADTYTDWAASADISVAILRTTAGRDPYDRALSDLVGELSTRSEEFRRRWAAHDVRLHLHGRKGFHHPAVGDLEMDFTSFPVDGATGLTLTAYAPIPGSPSQDALTLLSTLVATGHRAEAAARVLGEPGAGTPRN